SQLLADHLIDRHVNDVRARFLTALRRQGAGMTAGTIVDKNTAGHRHLAREHVPRAVAQIFAADNINLRDPTRGEDHNIWIQRQNVAVIHVMVRAYGHAQALELLYPPIDHTDQVTTPVLCTNSDLTAGLL